MSDANPVAWGGRALQHARLLTLPARGPATQAETEAALYAQRQLDQLGYSRVDLQAFSGLRSIWFFVSLTFGLAIMGHLGFVLLRPALGAWGAWLASALIFGFSFYLMFQRFRMRDFPLRENLPHGPSQNVVAAISPQSTVERNVVLHARLDTGRAAIWFAADALVTVYSVLAPLAIYGVIGAPLLYLLAVASGFAGFSVLAGLLAVTHFLAWFSGVSIDLGVHSPGANGNASGGGSLLALAEHLRRQPLQHTRIWLLFSGSSASGGDGMRAFLEQNRQHLENAIFINLESVGIGSQLAYIQSEGLIVPKRIPAGMEQILLSLGQPLTPLRLAGHGVFSETGLLWQRGYPAACLLQLRPGSNQPPEWQRLSDTPDKLEAEALERIHNTVWGLLQTLDGPVRSTQSGEKIILA